MKRVAALVLLAVPCLIWSAPALAQLMSVKDYEGQSRKAAKQQQKMLKKNLKKQRKAMNKYQKEQQKATKRANEELRRRKSS